MRAVSELRPFRDRGLKQESLADILLESRSAVLEAKTLQIPCYFPS
jgi:hypothetical protein